MLVVLLLIVFVDLITAVGVGIVLASLLFDKRLLEGHHHVGRLDVLRQAAAIIAANGDPAEHGDG